ncbi:hypothetical protein ACHAQA_001060 [Verticillium albo-atrum]
MPTYSTSQEWLEQSSLLLKARPSTTRITTAYSIKAAKPRRAKASEADGGAGADAPMTDAPAAKPPRGRLVIKTFDPASGVTLRYKTHKAAEVSRLILSLGRLGRGMAALPETSEEDMVDAPTAGKDDEAAEGKPSAGQPAQQQQPQGQAQGGASKKKKKGKK